MFSKIRKLFNYIVHPSLLFARIFSKTEKSFIILNYYYRMKKIIKLKKPKSFNEKLNWLKLYDRKTIYHTYVDKIEVKKIVAEKIGEEHIIPTISIFNKVEDISFNALPRNFVIKCSHDSGSTIICNDKDKLNIAEVKSILSEHLSNDWYKFGCEWAYKGIKPRIIVEQQIKSDKNINDYKLFCFNGKVLFFKVDYNRQTNHTEKYYDLSLNELPFFEKQLKKDTANDLQITKNNIINMKDMAEKLAVDIPFVRIDFYCVENKIYFGEMTFYPFAGYGEFEPEKWDRKIGDMLELPKINTTKIDINDFVHNYLRKNS